MQSESPSIRRSQQQIVRALHTRGPSTVRQLQDWTGFSHGAVVSSMGLLRSMGIVQDIGSRRADGLGRPSTLWHLRPEAAYVVGIDIGAANVRVLLLDLAGQHVYAMHEDTEALYRRAPAGSAVSREIARLVHRIVERSPLPHIQPRALGVALSGLVDSEHGRCLTCTNIPGWQNLDLVVELTATLDIPVLLEDSARAQAWAEHRYGRAREAQDFLYVNVGAGIGAALFIDGKVYRGPGGLGGELGHITVDEHGPRCGCGNRGCAEALVGARAIVRRTRELLSDHSYPSLLTTEIGQLPNGDLRPFGVEQVVGAASRGDTLAFRVLNEAGEYLGVAIAAALNLLGFPLVVLGGGVARAGDPFIDAVRRVVLLRALPPLVQRVQIERSTLDADAGAWGVGLHAIEAYLDRAWRS
jgi:predicted NBD/HSP70 family sugar kinase